MSTAALLSDFARSFARDDLVLYAGTNLPWPQHSMPDAECASMMPVIGSGPSKQQPNVRALAEIEQVAASQLCEIFRGRFAEARFHSCTQANLAVFVALLKPGDTVMCLGSSDGGHPSQNGDGMLAHLSVRLLSIPFDAENQRIDDAATASLVRQVRPRLVMYGPSVILRPSDFSQTAAATADVGATLVADVSHVAGLIAGGAFPNPLEHGADCITASSYKTLGCPPAGFIVAREMHLQARIESATSPKLLSNYDAGRLVRLAVALAESRPQFRSYAHATVANASALRAALMDLEIPLLTPADGICSTHQLVALSTSHQDAASAVDRLQANGVSTSMCGIPGRPGHWGVRLGTQLITRRGMEPEDMPEVARIISAALRASASQRGQVARLVARFPNLAFCEQPALLSP